MSDVATPWRFEAPFDRGSFRVRAAFAWLASFVLCLAAGRALESLSMVGVAVGIAGASLFAFFGTLSWRRSLVRHSPLVLDQEGLAVDDGLGTQWSLPWQEIERVQIDTSGLHRRVVLLVSNASGEGEVSLPRVCHGDAPAEWLAGLIETFRHQALHPRD